MNENNIDNSQEQQKLNIQELENGDVFFISGLTEDELLDIAISICKNLDKSILEHELKKEYFISGEAMRPGGCFSVRYEKNNNRLYIDNRNGRGVEQFTNKLKEAVYSATKIYL